MSSQQFQEFLEDVGSYKGSIVVVAFLSFLTVLTKIKFMIYLQFLVILAFFIYRTLDKVMDQNMKDRERFVVSTVGYMFILISFYVTGFETLTAEFLIFISYYGILALSLNVSTGLVGVVNFGVIAQVAVGSVIYGIATLNFGVSIFGAIILAMIGGALFSVLLASTTLQLRADYFAIVSIAVGEIIRQFLRTEPTLRAPIVEKGETPTTEGILSVPLPFRDQIINLTDGTSFENQYRLFLGLMCVLLFFTMFLVAQLLTYSPYGRVLRSIREDDLVASTYGKDLFRYRVGIFAISGAMAAVGGVILAWQFNSITPDNFRPFDTFYAWTIIIIGGRGNNKGTVVGAIIFVMIRRLSLFLEGDSLDKIGLNTFVHSINPDAPEQVSIGYIQLFLVGIMIILFVLFYPSGFISEEPYRPEIRGIKLPPAGSQADVESTTTESVNK